jgi:hypothetical protein
MPLRFGIFRNAPRAFAKLKICATVGAGRDRSRVCVLDKSVASQPMSMAHPSPQRPLTTAECATVSKTYHNLRLCACRDGRPIRQHREKSTAETSPISDACISKTREAAAWPYAALFRVGIVQSHKAYPARRCLCPFSRVRGATPATPLHGLFSMSPLSQPTRKGATVLRHEHGVLVILGNALLSAGAHGETPLASRR